MREIPSIYVLRQTNDINRPVRKLSIGFIDFIEKKEKAAKAAFVCFFGVICFQVFGWIRVVFEMIEWRRKQIRKFNLHRLFSHIVFGKKSLIFYRFEISQTNKTEPAKDKNAVERVFTAAISFAQSTNFWLCLKYFG